MFICHQYWNTNLRPILKLNPKILPKTRESFDLPSLLATVTNPAARKSFSQKIRELQIALEEKVEPQGKERLMWQFRGSRSHISIVKIKNGFSVAPNIGGEPIQNMMDARIIFYEATNTRESDLDGKVIATYPNTISLFFQDASLPCMLCENDGSCHADKLIERIYRCFRKK